MQESTELLPVIQKALKDLRYGTVQLVVHDGELVRIERLERIRLPSGQRVQPTLTGNSGS